MRHIEQPHIIPQPTWRLQPGSREAAAPWELQGSPPPSDAPASQSCSEAAASRDVGSWHSPQLLNLVLPLRTCNPSGCWGSVPFASHLWAAWSTLSSEPFHLQIFHYEEGTWALKSMPESKRLSALTFPPPVPSINLPCLQPVLTAITRSKGCSRS